jgi:hypothetical protein
MSDRLGQEALTFAVLRGLAMIGGLAALSIVPLRPEHQIHLWPLLAAFIIYKGGLFALLFLVFDVLGVLLYPWAMELRRLGALGLGVPALGAVLVFVGLLTVGWTYAWKKKGLEWR